MRCAQMEKAAGPGHYGFFVLMALYSFSCACPYSPGFPGRGADGDYPVLVYVPFLAKAALAANKRCPCTIRKRITFSMKTLTFSNKGVTPEHSPTTVSTLCRTRHALLFFLFGKKLVLWLPLHLAGCGTAGKHHAQVRNHGRGSEGSPDAEGQPAPSGKGQICRFAVLFD
ncbi:MAG: hypothetical protein ACLSUW_08900 [Akkermansia sp.]